MTKNKKKLNESYTGDRNVVQENLSEHAKEHTLIFAKNTNIMRQLPRAEDGLKTVERRILYAMYLLGATPFKDTKKSARINGDVMGKFHPHGDTYGTLVRIAQPWESHIPLVTGQGNFGSQSGKPAAAMRYTEAKLSLYTWKCFFEDFNINHTETRMNYIDTEPEPVYLASRYPNVLANSSQFGIGVGTNVIIPHFNFQEVVEVTLSLMDNPNTPFMLIPDLPTGADILATSDFSQINEVGRGSLKMRAHISIDDEKHTLTVTSLPVQTTVEGVKKRIMEYHDAKKFPGLVDFANDSDDTSHGIQFEIIMRKEIDLYKIRQELYSKMGLEKSIGVNIKAIDNYQENDYSIRELLLTWIDLRREDKRMKFNHEILDYREREHILDTILRIFEGTNAEKSLKSIRKASNRAEIIEFLMRDFDISSLQAKMIADMKMSTFSTEGVKNLKNEYEEITKKHLPRLLKIMKSTKTIDKIIKAELEEGIKLFGSPRKSKVVSIEGEEAVRNTEHFIVITAKGLIKKLPSDIKSIGHIAQDDYPTDIIKVHNKKDLLIFDESGTVNKVPVNDVMNTLMNSGGEDLSTYAKINGRVCSVLVMSDEDELDSSSEKSYYVMITKNGLIKKTEVSKYMGIKNDLLAMIIKDNDRMQTVKLIKGESDLLVYTATGFGGRFNSEEVRESNRMSVGVKSIDLDDHDEIIGLDVISDDDNYIFVLTSKGTGKKCTLNTFPSDVRNSKPYRVITLVKNESISKITPVVGDETFKVFLSSGSEEIVIQGVEELTRLSRGKKLIPVRKGDNIIDVKKM